MCGFSREKAAGSVARAGGNRVNVGHRFTKIRDPETSVNALSRLISRRERSIKYASFGS